MVEQSRYPGLQHREHLRRFSDCLLQSAQCSTDEFVLVKSAKNRKRAQRRQFRVRAVSPSRSTYLFGISLFLFVLCSKLGDNRGDVGCRMSLTGIRVQVNTFISRQLIFSFFLSQKESSHLSLVHSCCISCRCLTRPANMRRRLRELH